MGEFSVCRLRLAGAVIGDGPFEHWHSLIARSDVAAVDLAGADRWQQLAFSASANACFFDKQQQSAEPQQDCEALDTSSPVRFVTSFESAQIDCAYPNVGEQAITATNIRQFVRRRRFRNRCIDCQAFE